MLNTPRNKLVISAHPIRWIQSETHSWQCHQTSNTGASWDLPHQPRMTLREKKNNLLSASVQLIYTLRYSSVGSLKLLSKVFALVFEPVVFAHLFDVFRGLLARPITFFLCPTKTNQQRDSIRFAVALCKETTPKLSIQPEWIPILSCSWTPGMCRTLNDDMAASKSRDMLPISPACRLLFLLGNPDATM